MKPALVLFCCVLTAGLLLVTCKPATKPIPGRFYTGILFGKPYQIDAVGDSTDFQPQIDSIIRVFESNFYLDKASSVLARLNAFSRTDTVFAFYDSTKAFGIVYDLTRDLNMHTMQYFDPTMNPVKRAWIVANSGGALEPNLDSLYNFVGFDGAKLDLNEITTEGYQYKESQIRKSDPRIEADFTVVAASVALDQIGEMLRNRGVKQFRIKYGRDVITFGNLIDSLNVVAIGIGNDSADQKIRMINRAFSSKNTQDKTMMIDPTYGYPADNEMAFVAVCAPSLAEAEAFSEAFMLMGLEKAMEYYNRNEQSKIESFMFYSQDSDLHSASTEGFDAIIIPMDSLVVK